MKQLGISVALALLALGCGSGSDNGAAAHPCASETFVLTGELDGQTLDLTLPLGSFWFESTAGGDAGAQYGTQGALAMTYPTALEPGKAVPATGTLTLPAESPTRAGETLCAGQGSTFTNAGHDGLYTAAEFSLAGLAAGASCETPVDGTLDGCFAHTFEEGP